MAPPPVEDRGREAATPAQGVVDLWDPGAAGALAVVRAYYRAIDSGDYLSAYGFWENGGRTSGQSFEEFAAGFAQTAAVSVETGSPSRIEGAAGSRYIEIPVTISATLTSGTSQSFEGSYVLRRVVVDGATVEARRWHIYSADISRAD